jgi:hypothetical protein
LKGYQVPVWAFEWSINSDVGCDSVTPNTKGCANLNDYDYLLSLDANPMYKNGPKFEFDPINLKSAADHALGTESTLMGKDNKCVDSSGSWTCAASTGKCNVAKDAKGGGCLQNTETNYATGIDTLQVAQNSWQYVFFLPTNSVKLRNEPGIYTIELIAKKKDDDKSGSRKTGPSEEEEEDEEDLCGKKPSEGGKQDKNILARSKITILVGLEGDFPKSEADCQNFSWVTYKLFDSENECIAFTKKEYA